MARSFARWIAVLLWAGVAVAADPATEPAPGVVRVACVGDSITYGAGLKDREHESYPARLGVLLGDGYVVRNFGVNGTTALHTADRPYVGRPAYAKALAFKPDVLVLGLGTNDTKPQNWTSADAFAADYAAIVAAFKKANPGAKVFVCLPIKCYLDGEWSIRDRLIEGEVIPAVKRVADRVGATTIDWRKALAGGPALLSDSIHPTAEGTKLMADAVAAALKPP